MRPSVGIVVLLWMLMVLPAWAGTTPEWCRDSSLKTQQLWDARKDVMGKDRAYVRSLLGEPKQIRHRVSSKDKVVVDEEYTARFKYTAHYFESVYNSDRKQFEMVPKTEERIGCMRMSVGYFENSDSVIGTIVW